MSRFIVDDNGLRRFYEQLLMFVDSYMMLKSSSSYEMFLKLGEECRDQLTLNRAELRFYNEQHFQWFKKQLRFKFCIPTRLSLPFEY